VTETDLTPGDADLLTTSDVAKIARTSPGTVRYWRHIGQGPGGFKVGRRVLYRRADVLAWLDQLQAADNTQGVSAP
jgi:DNA-binding transcriptional MerR regulator